MKKKKTIYLMMPLIILVWGFVFFQVYNYFFSKPAYATEVVKEMIRIDEIKQDTFSIVADYRDPFLGKKEQFRGNNSSSNTTKKRSKPTQTKIERPWPLITYNGMIKNNNSDRRVGIVNVDGKEYLVKEKDVVNDIIILAINKNEVNVRFQKENKTITK